MSVVASILLAAAVKVGAPLVKSVLEKHAGPVAGSLAGTIIDKVAVTLGVEPSALPTMPVSDLEMAVAEVDASMPELIALYAQGLKGQYALLAAEQAEGFWQSAWRWGWMYFLGLLWGWALLVTPIVRAAGLPLEPIDLAVLLTLTSWFIGLYMGGHTIKEMGKQAVEAIKTFKGIGSK